MDEQTRAKLIDWLNAFKADPFSTGADKVDRLLEVVAAHSVIAGKVAELIEALIEARSAIATWSETPCEHDYKKHDALCYIDAALAPYPERRHE